MAHEELISNLSHPNKIKRRNALNDLNCMINGGEIEISSSELHTLILNLEVHIISRLSDESQINRNKACKILENILEKREKTKTMISYLIPTLCHRMGKSPLIEDCEENRLSFLILIDSIIDVYGSDIQIYINDICSIFTNSLNDNYPEVILKACDCITKLPAVTEPKFQMFSSSFVKPLLRCIAKHRLKVRVKSINTLECVFTYGNSQEFEEVNNTLAKCILDIPQVRFALLSYGFTLSVKMKERYSFWPTLLPLILFGLRDDNAEIQKAAESFWNKIGSQYEIENEDLKNSSVVDHTEQETNEGILTQKYNFGVGCCTLIQRNFHRMFEHISRNLRDWQVDVKLQALKLLTISVWGLLDSSLQYSNKIINSLLFHVNDQDPRISSECILCAEYLGRFIPPDLYVPLIEPSLWGESEGCLCILSAFVRNTPSRRLQTSLTLFANALSFTNIEKTLSFRKENEILKIMQHLFTFCKFDYFEEDFIFTLFYIIGHRSCSHASAEKEMSLNVIKVASKCYGADSIEDFIRDRVKTSLLKLKESSSWNEESDPEICVFRFLSEYEGFALYLEDVAAILKIKLDNENTPLVAFTVLQALKDVLHRAYLSENEKLMQDWSIYLLKEHILELLPRSRGKTGESLRLASISSLISILKYSGKASSGVFEVLKPCLDYLPALTCEDIVETRVLSCSFIELYYCTYLNFTETTKFFEFMKLLTKRLDDVDVKVRRVAARSLMSCFKVFPNLKENLGEVKAVMCSVVIYLHEDDLSIQQNVLEMLKAFDEHCPNHLHSILENSECDENILQRLKSVRIEQ